VAAAEERPAARPEPVEAAVRPAARPEPVEAAVRPEPPRVNPQEYLAGAGLQMVETKAGAAHAPVTEEEAKLGRPRRERAAVAEEPLVQVETRNK
jgi:ribonuclease E